MAILFVLFAHIGGNLFIGSYAHVYGDLRYWLEPGTGVDLFFCISGYVITRQYAREAPSTMSLAAFYGFAFPFWIRRFWRLAPSAWLWLSLGLAYLALTQDQVLENSIKDATSAVLQIANFHFYECMNRINATTCGTYSVYWSLSLEEQFYLLFPFVLALIPRRFIIPFFAAVFFAQAFVPRSFAGLMWLVRTDAIALGVILALLQDSPSYRLLEPRFLASFPARFIWVAACLSLLATLDAPKVHFVEFTIGVVAVVSAALVWTASYEKDYSAPIGIVKRVLVFVGARSYGLYLIHHPGMWFAVWLLHRLELPSVGAYGLLVFPMIFGLAELNYRLIETPLRAHGARVASRFKERALGDMPVAASDVAPIPVRVLRSL